MFPEHGILELQQTGLLKLFNTRFEFSVFYCVRQLCVCDLVMR